MKPSITLQMTVNECSSRYPKTQIVLARHGLDLCCGGMHPIGMAAQAHGVDAALLLRELNEAAAAGSAR